MPHSHFGLDFDFIKEKIKRQEEKYKGDLGKFTEEAQLFETQIRRSWQNSWEDYWGEGPWNNSFWGNFLLGDPVSLVTAPHPSKPHTTYGRSPLNDYYATWDLDEQIANLRECSVLDRKQITELQRKVSQMEEQLKQTKEAFEREASRPKPTPMPSAQIEEVIRSVVESSVAEWRAQIHKNLKTLFDRSDVDGIASASLAERQTKNEALMQVVLQSLNQLAPRIDSLEHDREHLIHKTASLSDDYSGIINLLTNLDGDLRRKIDDVVRELSFRFEERLHTKVGSASDAFGQKMKVEREAAYKDFHQYLSDYKQELKSSNRFLAIGLGLALAIGPIALYLLACLLSGS